MPYIRGRGFQLGLELGQAKADDERERMYREDRDRALAQEAADAQGGDLQLALMQAQAKKRLGGLGPTEFGPEDPAIQKKRDQIDMRFERIREVAKRMNVQNRARFLQESQEAMKQQVLDRARQKVAHGIQDRLAKGAFNFLDEKEPNPALMARIEALTQGLDSQQIDPVKAAEVEAAILESVREENKRRMARARGTAAIDQLVSSAATSGNQDLAANYEALKAMWLTDEMKPDDLADAIFEAQYGRKTARAAGPNEFEVRKEAMRLWEAYETGPPTEEGLRKYAELLTGPPPIVTPNRKEVIRASTAVPGARGTEPGRGGAAPTTAPPSPPAQPEQAPTPAKPKAEAKPEGGAPPRPWAKLTPKEQEQAEKDLVAAARDGYDMRKAMRGVGISDPDSIPTNLKKRLIALAKESGRPTTVGRTILSGPSEEMKRLAIEEGRRRRKQ